MKASSENTSNTTGTRRAYRYAFLLGILITLLCAVFLFVYGKDKSNKNEIFSVATDLIAASIFAIIFSFLANKEFEYLIKEEISVIKSDILGKIESVVKQEYNQYNPTQTYNATSDIDTNFNHDLTIDLKKTSSYIFRGVSAKYVAVRVNQVKHSLSILKVLILDPRDSRSINFRASDRGLNPKNRHKSMEELCEEIKKEIYFGIIALFECRKICPVEIYYEFGTAVFRQEIFDDALYLSFYHTEKSKGSTFPESFKYSKNTIPFYLYRLDTFRCLELLQDSVKRFSADNLEDELLPYLRYMGLNNPETFMIKYKTEYDSFSLDFIAESKMSSY